METSTNNDYRSVPTGLTGKKNFEILSSVIGQLSDGMWENSPRMESYWRFLNIAMADGEKVVIRVKNKTSEFTYRKKWVYNKLYHESPEMICKWFADKVKAIVKADLGQNQGKNLWKRDNTERVLNYLGYHEKLTVADAYNAYDILKGRKTELAA